MTAVLEAPVSLPTELAHVTVRSADLHNLLKTAGTFASSNATLPVLNAVQLERRGNYLVAVATDRFRLAVVRIPIVTLEGESKPVDASGDFVALLSIAQVKATLPMLKVSARDANYLQVRLTLTEGVAIRSVQWTRNDRAVSGTFRDESTDLSFPKWRQLIPADRGPINATDTLDASRFGVNADYLKDFAAAAWTKRDSEIVVEPGAANRPIVVRVGTHFLGMIMPVRVGGHECNSSDTRASWTDTLS